MEITMQNLEKTLMPIKVGDLIRFRQDWKEVMSHAIFAERAKWRIVRFSRTTDDISAWENHIRRWTRNINIEPGDYILMSRKEPEIIDEALRLINVRGYYLPRIFFRIVGGTIRQQVLRSPNLYVASSDRHTIILRRQYNEKS